MKKTLLISTLLALGLAAPAMATMNAAPSGATSLGCDMNTFEPVLNSDGTVGYWNNPSCSLVSERPEAPQERHTGPKPDVDPGKGEDDC